MSTPSQGLGSDVDSYLYCVLLSPQMDVSNIWSVLLYTSTQYVTSMFMSEKGALH